MSCELIPGDCALLPADLPMDDHSTVHPAAAELDNPFAPNSVRVSPKQDHSRQKHKDSSRKRLRIDVANELDVMRKANAGTALIHLLEKLVKTIEDMGEKVEAQQLEISRLTRALKLSNVDHTTHRQQLRFQPITTSSAEQQTPVPPEETTKTWSQIVSQGNGQPTAPLTHRLAVGKIQSKKVVGNKKDSVTFSQVQVYTATETAPNNVLMKKLTLPEARPAKSIEAVPIRIEKTMPRDQCPAKEWRAALKEKNIKPFTILFPYRTSVEILVPKTDIEKMRDFLGEIKRSPVDANPFLRRDGQIGPLSQESIQRTIEQRITMLKFETSLVGAKYLQESIANGLTLLQNVDLKENLQRSLEKTLKEKFLQLPTSQQRS